MPALDIIASIALTAMSTVVAVVALAFSYRQNVSWRPVAIISQTFLSGIGGSSDYKIHLSVEIWNRRKFPIALRFAHVKVSGVIVDDSQSDNQNNLCYTRNNDSHKEISTSVDPLKSTEIKFEFGFKNQSLDVIRPMFEIELSYFNPQKNRTEKLLITHKLFEKSMGWDKTEEQRFKVYNIQKSILSKK